jgi:rhamnulokinase
VPVTAGPVEATALGNVLVQARTHAAAPSSLESLRSTLAIAGQGGAVKRYSPT